MKKIRINELARELEVKPGVIIALLTELGVNDKKTHSSSIDEDIALAVRHRVLAESSQNGDTSSALESYPDSAVETARSKEKMTETSVAVAEPPVEEERPSRPAAQPVHAEPPRQEPPAQAKALVSTAASGTATTIAGLSEQTQPKPMAQQPAAAAAGSPALPAAPTPPATPGIPEPEKPRSFGPLRPARSIGRRHPSAAGFAIFGNCLTGPGESNTDETGAANHRSSAARPFARLARGNRFQVNPCGKARRFPSSVRLVRLLRPWLAQRGLPLRLQRKPYRGISPRRRLTSCFPDRLRRQRPPQFPAAPVPRPPAPPRPPNLTPGAPIAPRPQGGTRFVGQPPARPVVPPRPDMLARLQPQQRTSVADARSASA